MTSAACRYQRASSSSFSSPPLSPYHTFGQWDFYPPFYCAVKSGQSGNGLGLAYFPTHPRFLYYLSSNGFSTYFLKTVYLRGTLTYPVPTLAGLTVPVLDERDKREKKRDALGTSMGT